MNSVTLTINDEYIDRRFQTYLLAKAVKYFPFFVVQSLSLTVIVAIVFGFSFRLLLISFYFICSVVGLIIARRNSRTASYFAMFLTELAIIIALLA